MSDALLQLWVSLRDFLAQLFLVLGLLGQYLLPLLPGGLWCAWWLWCVNWKKAWPILARGGWVVPLLLIFASALAWSVIFPSSFNLFGFPVPNYWWQLVACATLGAVALFCGYLQGRWDLTPEEVSFAPPAAEHGHHHGHH